MNRYIGSLLNVLFVFIMVCCKKELHTEEEKTTGPETNVLNGQVGSGKTYSVCLAMDGKAEIKIDKANAAASGYWIDDPSNSSLNRVFTSPSVQKYVLKTPFELNLSQALYKCKNDTQTVYGKSGSVVSECIYPGHIIRMDVSNVCNPGSQVFWSPVQSYSRYQYTSVAGNFSALVYDSLQTDSLFFHIINCYQQPDTLNLIMGKAAPTGTCLSVKKIVRLNAPSGQTFLWSTGQKTKSILVNEPGMYTLKANGITIDTTTFNIQYCGSEIQIPPYFSPNGDGVQDIWKVKSAAVKDLAIQVKNSTGVILFNSSSSDNGWDGTYKGQAVAEGAYFYEVSYTRSDQTRNSIKGQLQLIR